MKGGLAVMLEVAGAVASGGLAGDLDLAFLFSGREELPFAESALLPFLERTPALHGAALAIVLEPTANRLELGCLGNLTARVTFEGEAAHTARPWLGRNALHDAVTALAPLADLPVREVAIDGLVYREVVSVTTLTGGTATNVVPDRAVATVNLRYAPTHTADEAERRLGELLGRPGASIEVLGNAPPGPVPSANPLVERLRAAGGLEVAPKQAWTPVAELALVGIDAVNFGPGDPQYAHRDDEHVEVADLVRSLDVLRAFVEGRAAEA
jgi:succinyl-diaminopimelate desuccinylase